MLNKCAALCLSLLGVIGAVGTANAADTCFEVRGRVDTQALADQSHQVGVARLEIGEKKFVGGIAGTIAQYLSQTSVLLDHNMGFPGSGTIVTNGDLATLTGMLDACRMGITEAIHYTYGTGVFANATLTATATGTLNFCTGENRFSVTGNMCYAAGTAPLSLGSDK